MDADVATLNSLGVTGVLRLLELGLHLFAFAFPEQAQVQDKSSYDFIIVGAGAAGCVLARRLSDNPNYNVLLIEAGDNPTLEVMLPGLASYNQFSQFDWNYRSEKDSNIFQCYLGDVFETARGRGLGGCTCINYMLYTRGDPNDYRQWAKLANDQSWNYDKVLHYFKKSERLEDYNVLNSPHGRFHGTKGEMGVTVYPDPDKIKYLNALKEVGYDIVLDTNGNHTLGFNFPMYTAAQGMRQSTCYCFVSPVKDRKNLHVLKNTKVTKVLFSGNVASGVEVITKSNETMTFNAKLEVILSAGAFNTPQILMLSGIGPKDHLQSFNIPAKVDLPVGYNLQDHIGVFLFHKTDPYNLADARINPFKPEENYINGFVTLNKSQNFPDAQYLLMSSRNSPVALGIFEGLDNDIYQKATRASKTNEILLTFVLNIRPSSRGRVMLRSTDPNDAPKIYLGAFSNKIDIKNTVRYIQDYLRIEKSEYFKSVKAERIDLAGDRCKGFTMDSQEYWECYARCLMVSIFHYCGTCPMGTVVDSKLRVLGVQRLRIVDASVFPIIPSANINAPTIMTAEKAADMIKKDH